MVELTVAAVKKLKVTELKVELSSRGLATKGKKDELVKRLLQALEDSGETIDQDASQSSVVSATDESMNDSQESLNESQESVLEDPSQKTEEPAATADEIKDDSKADDDWVMVEPPKPDEVEAANQLAEEQDTTDKSSAEDVDMQENAQPVEQEKNEPTAESTSNQNEDDVTMKNENAETPMEDDSTKASNEEAKEKSSESGQSEKPKEETKDSSKTPEKVKKEEPKPEDKYVEVEAEDGEDVDSVVIEDGHIGLDSYVCDLNFVVGEKGLTGHNLVKNGFSYMWAGARANKGAKGGKVGYEVKILENLEVEMPEHENPVHGVRVGWSTENSIMQLGEAEKSYGYESTGKLCASSSFVNYGETFTAGDVIGSFLDLESEPKTLSFTKNGQPLGLAMSLQVNLDEKPLFPHILVRNAKVELNFGAQEDPWFELLEEYKLLQNAGEENIADRQTTPPESKDKCTVLLMVGLPNAGKTTWARKYMDTHSDQQFNLISLATILDRCRIEGKRRHRSDKGHGDFMKNVIKILTKCFEICPKKTRNYILDQNNVYLTAQESKMGPFTDFKRKAVVVVPTHDNLRKRTSDTKRKGESIHDIPFGDLCDMKCEFNIPEVGSIFEEIIYPELDERNARKTVSDYKSDGSRAKKTGKDEFYPKKRNRHDDRYGRDRYGGGRYRDDGWRNSGSGYGGGYASGGYGSNKNYKDKRSGDYSRGGRDNYQDPYRRPSGGSGGGGYRQNSGYGGGGGYNRNYGSGGYSQGNYGSAGGYGSNYGSNYGGSGYQSGYGSGYNNQTYNQSQRGSNTSGGSNWGQYNQASSNYSQPTGGWNSSSNTGTGGWSGYNTYGGYYGSGSNYGSGSGGYGGGSY